MIVVDVIVAILGGLYFLVKGIIEHIRGEKIEKENERILANREKFQNLTMDFKTQEKLTNKVLCGLYSDEIYEDLKDNLTAMYGENYKEKFVIPGAEGYINDTDRYYLSTTWYWAYILLMSKLGKFEFNSSLYYGERCPTKYIGSGIYEQLEKNLKETVGKNPDCPPIRIVEQNGKMIFEFMLRERDERKYLW